MFLILKEQDKSELLALKTIEDDINEVLLNVYINNFIYMIIF